MQKFKEADGGNPDGTAKDAITGVQTGTKYKAEYYNDNIFNLFEFVENAGYQLIPDDLSQIVKAAKGEYNPSYTYNTSAVATQTVNDIVLGSNGAYYEAQSDGFSGDNPVGSVTGNWKPYDKFNLKNKNLLMNANGLVNQREYVSGTATTIANQYTLDRWRVVTLGQNLTFVTTNNETTFTAPAGGVEQIIESLNVQSGFYFPTIGGTATLVIEDSPDNITYTPIAPNSDGSYTLVGGRYVKFKLSNGTFKKPQLEPGTVATAFEQVGYGDDEIRCKRYYWKPVLSISGFRTWHSNNKGAITIQHPVSMRIAPASTYTFEIDDVPVAPDNLGITKDHATLSASAGVTSHVDLIAYEADAEL